MEILEMTLFHLLSWCQTRMDHFLKSCRVFNEMLAAVYVTHKKGIGVEELDLLFRVMNAYIMKIMTEHSSVKLAKLTSQSAFTFSKLTIKTLEQGVKYVQS